LAVEEFFEAQPAVVILVTAVEHRVAVLVCFGGSRGCDGGGRGRLDLGFRFVVGAELRAERGDDGGSVGGDVLRFAGVVAVIVELELGRGRIAARGFPFDEAVALGADGAAEALAAGIDVDRVVAVRGGLGAMLKEEIQAAYLSFRREDPVNWSKFQRLFVDPATIWVAAKDSDYDELRALARSVKHLDLLN